MHRAIQLPDNQKDLHCFAWKKDLEEELMEYRMTLLTFGVCVSSFAANMALRQNAISHSKSHPQAAQAVLESFYVDDELTSAGSVHKAIKLRTKLQDLFELGCFT